MEFDNFVKLVQDYKVLCSGEIEGKELYDFQIKIMNEIIRIENKIKETENIIKEQKGKTANDLKERIEISNLIKKAKDDIYDLKGYILEVKGIMDALAYMIFSKFDLKNLCFGQSSGYLSGKKGIEKELETLKELIEMGKIAILNDLTNCITVGDISEKLDDRINLIEVKTSNGKNYRIIRQEDRRRFYVNYLQNDTIEDLYGKGFKRVYVCSEENYIVELNNLIKRAINKHTVIQKMENGLYYSVMYKPKKKDMMALQLIKDKIRSPICFWINGFKNSNDLSNNPFLNCFHDIMHYFYFKNGDLLISVFLDFDLLQKKFEKKNMFIERIKDEQWELEIEFMRNGEKDKMYVSKHNFHRIGRDFLKLDYYISTITAVNEAVQKM